MKFTHNNRRHAEQKHTPFKLILGDNPISVPITFQHTKYLNIEEKMKCMIQEREEALAAHELARKKMANWKQSIFVPFEKEQKVWLDTQNFKLTTTRRLPPNKKDHLK